MAKQKLREAIATEAARLILRGKETEYAVARKRAARWLSRRKVDSVDMPSAAEIQSQLHLLAGLFTNEHQSAALLAMREAALELMVLLEDFQPRLFGCVVDGPVLPGSEITLRVAASTLDDVISMLDIAGFHTRVCRVETGRGPGGEPEGEVVRFHHRFPCEITVRGDGSAADQQVDDSIVEGEIDYPKLESQEYIDPGQLRRLIEQTGGPATIQTETTHPEPADEHQYHPDAFATMHLLLKRLGQVQFDSADHPEGNVLYHSLQVFERGLSERPYDEEFLLACLLHDAGMAIDRRDPVRALLRALGDLISERTRFLIENRSAGLEYLQTGKMSRSLRRSEHFDDLVLLARCDREGRTPGAEVCELDEALNSIQSLETSWDDV